MSSGTVQVVNVNSDGSDGTVVGNSTINSDSTFNVAFTWEHPTATSTWSRWGTTTSIECRPQAM